MFTRNVILGATATCLAVGSAFASYLNAANVRVRLSPSDPAIIVTGTAPNCSGDVKCLVKVKTHGQSFTLATQATVVTLVNGVATPVPGAGLTGITLFTRGQG